MPPEDYLRRSPVRFDEENYQACYEYWLRLKGARKSPKWSEWDWFAIPVKLIPYFLVVDVIPATGQEPRDYVYRFYGTASVTMHSFDFTNLSIRKIRSPVTAKSTAEQYYEVTETHEAIGSAYLIQAGEDGLPHVQTSLRMPFSNDGETVSQIATYCDWSRDIQRIREDHIRAYGERPK